MLETLRGPKGPCSYVVYEWMSNYGPFLGTLNIWCRIIIGIQKGAIILTTTHIIRAQKGSHVTTSGPRYILYSTHGPFGKVKGIRVGQAFRSYVPFMDNAFKV